MSSTTPRASLALSRLASRAHPARLTCSALAIPRQRRYVSTEGLHYRDQAEPVHHGSSQPSTSTSISRLPGDDRSLKHQDWVLFHPVYDESEVHQVKVVHHNYSKTSDKIARGMVTMARKTFDIVTGYKQGDLTASLKGKEHLSLEQLRAQKLVMSPDQWLQRIIFLESIAGVPGMAAGVLRHLKSLRVVRRDGGWIRTLLADAENERMHLLTFLKVKKPSLLMRAMLFAAQGVFFNAFFFSYLFWPSACHRFVGALEEEAVHTYSVLISELEAGRLPEWRHKAAPQIAIDYWRMPSDATMLELIYNVRADESQHRFVNHTLANLDQVNDSNPFAICEPSAEVKGTQAGFTREEAQAWTEQMESKAKAALEHNISSERSHNIH